MEFLWDLGSQFLVTRQTAVVIVTSIGMAVTTATSPKDLYTRDSQGESPLEQELPLHKQKALS